MRSQRCEPAAICGSNLRTPSEGIGRAARNYSDLCSFLGIEEDPADTHSTPVLAWTSDGRPPVIDPLESSPQELASPDVSAGCQYLEFETPPLGLLSDWRLSPGKDSPTWPGTPRTISR
jgi:hypothetical protein